MTRAIKIAFICDSGVNRSKTFADHLSQRFGPESNYYFNYGGINAYYDDCQLRPYHFEYYDVIYVMDLKQQMWITRNISEEFWHKVFLIGISDEYDHMDPKLIELVDYWLENWIKHIDLFLQTFPEE